MGAQFEVPIAPVLCLDAGGHVLCSRAVGNRVVSGPKSSRPGRSAVAKGEMWGASRSHTPRISSCSRRGTGAARHRCTRATSSWGILLPSLRSMVVSTPRVASELLAGPARAARGPPTLRRGWPSQAPAGAVVQLGPPKERAPQGSDHLCGWAGVFRPEAMGWAQSWGEAEPTGVKLQPGYRQRRQDQGPGGTFAFQ